MAELVAFGASIVAFIHLADRVIELSKFYLEGLQDCPHDIRVILVEVSSLKAILQTLSYLIGTSSGASQSPGLLQQLSGKDGPVEGCREAIASLEKLLPPHSRTAVRKRRKLDTVMSQLAWPLKQSQAKKLLDEIMRNKTSISFALTSETAKDIRDIKANLSEVQQLLTYEQRQNFCTWIEQTNPTRRHNDSCELHEHHTGGWMIRSSEWQAWLQGSKKFLWIHGIPGAGKTVLVSFLIEQAKCSYDSKRQAVVYYYCYFAQNQDEAKPLLRWLIGQLCRKSGAVPREIMGLFQISHEPSLVQLLQALHSILQEFDTVYFVIDAVDESLPRETLVKVIRDLATDQRFAKIRLLVTSREYIDIETAFSPISIAVSMTNELVTEDIQIYVHAALRSHTKFANWPQDLLLEVEEALSEGAKGMFRWAVCQIDAIQRLRGQQHEDIRKAIKSLPKTLDETYERIFMSIREDDYPFVEASISLICAYDDNRPMPVMPADNLLKLILHSQSSPTLDTEQQTFTLADLRDICGCLLTLSMEADGYDVLELAHYTVKEYLYSDRITRSQASKFALSNSIIRRMFATTVLSVACQAAGWDQDYGRNNIDHFGPFCVTMSLELLRVYETDALQDRRLQHLYHMFLNPSRPSWEILSWQGGNWDVSFPMISFARLPNNLNVAIFANLISARLLSLAEDFLKTLDVEEVLFRSPIHTHGDWGSHAGAVIGRSLLDFFREWYHNCDFITDEEFQEDGGDYFSRIVEITINFYDPTAALLIYLGEHQHSQPGRCRIYVFLDRGADPDAVGYRITPLQIATWRLDFDALEELLESGADVNATGDPNSAIPKLFPAILDLIPSDVTPLSLARNTEKMGITGGVSGEGFKGVIQNIEDLLRAHGAKEGD